MNEAGRSAGPRARRAKVDARPRPRPPRRDRPAVRRRSARALGGGLAGHNGLKSLQARARRRRTSRACASASAGPTRPTRRSSPRYVLGRWRQSRGRGRATSSTARATPPSGSCSATSSSNARHRGAATPGPAAPDGRPIRCWRARSPNPSVRRAAAKAIARITSKGPSRRLWPRRRGGPPCLRREIAAIAGRLMMPVVSRPRAERRATPAQAGSGCDLMNARRRRRASDTPPTPEPAPLGAPSSQRLRPEATGARRRGAARRCTTSHCVTTCGLPPSAASARRRRSAAHARGGGPPRRPSPSWRGLCRRSGALTRKRRAATATTASAMPAAGASSPSIPTRLSSARDRGDDLVGRPEAAAMHPRTDQRAPGR